MKRQQPRPRGSLVAAADLGTTKTVCFISRLDADAPRIVGIGHHLSRGLRGGQIVDLDAAANSLLNAVHAAEQMAGERINEILVNLSCGAPSSRIVAADIAIGGREVTDADMKRVLNHGHHVREQQDRQIVHSIPVGFSIDGSRGIRDPRGMFGEKLGINMHVVSAGSAALRNLASCVGRCHLEAEGFVAASYAAGLACLVEDEIDLGVTVIDMGGGMTSLAVFFDGNLVHTDSVAIGGVQVTNDIARGLSTPTLQAERVKTLYGNAITSPGDDREIIAIPQIGEEEDGQLSQVPKSALVGIISPRVEETFELIRDKLEHSGIDRIAGRRVVLTGGACQLPGAKELCAMVLDKQVRIGRPIRVKGLAESTGGPAFATAAGLLNFAVSERAEVRHPGRASLEERGGLFGKVGQWLSLNF